MWYKWKQHVTITKTRSYKFENLSGDWSPYYEKIIGRMNNRHSPSRMVNQSRSSTLHSSPPSSQPSPPSSPPSLISRPLTLCSPAVKFQRALPRWIQVEPWASWIHAQVQLHQATTRR